MKTISITTPEYWNRMLRPLRKMTPNYALYIVILLACCHPSTISCQNYLGFGVHLTPPIYLEYPDNAYVNTRAQPGIAGSLSFKKEWAQKKGHKWYAETGLTLQSIRYHQTDYTNDSINIWTDFPNQHIGFPSILLGGGRAFRIGKSNSEISMGLEASFLIVQDLDEISSYRFGILHDPVKDATLPLYLRLNLAYNDNLRLSKSLAGQLQCYTNLSVQPVTKGAQFIRNPTDANYLSGRYHLNNSELGIKFFLCLNKNSLKPTPNKTNADALHAEKR